MRSILFSIFALFISACSHYQPDEASIHRDDLRTPSYKMLNVSISEREYSLNQSLLKNVKLPRKLIKFYHLQDKAIDNDIKSNYLLFLIYFSDSECARRSIVDFKRVADENCTIALSYLNKTIELDDKFEAGLYKLAYLYNYGIGVDEDFNKSIEYYERLINIKGKYRVLALEKAANIYFVKLNQLNKAKHYYEICAQEKGEICQFKLANWQESLKIRRQIMKQEGRL